MKTAVGSRSDQVGFREVVDSIPGHVIVMRADGEVEFLNHQVLDYFGKTLDELKDWTMRDMVHPEDFPRVSAAWKRALATGDRYDIQFRGRRSDGVYHWLHTRGLPARDAHGRIVRWYLLETDIDDYKRAEEALPASEQSIDPSERKKAEEALRNSEQELRLLLETVPAMMLRTAPDGNVEYINQRFANYVGRSVEDLTNYRCREIVHPDDLDTAARVWARAFQTETMPGAQYRLRRADGVYRWFQINAEPLRDVDGHVVHWYGVHIDIDDSKRAEDALSATRAKLSRATQVATVAELAASIAHEINQPLAALVANAHACQRWLSAEPPNLERAHVTVERIIRDGREAGEIVSRIRALFKRTALTRTLLDLNEVIAEVSRLMSDELSSRSVTVATDLDTDLPATWVDRVQLQQVIVNLVRNGIEAMESAGRDPKVLSIRSRRDGPDSIVIEIHDNGIGLEDVERIFEPFFSTKGHGMGMGLAICRSIVEAHQGQLWATSNSLQGATFSLKLPVVVGGANGSR